MNDPRVQFKQDGTGVAVCHGLVGLPAAVEAVCPDPYPSHEESGYRWQSPA